MSSSPRPLCQALAALIGALLLVGTADAAVHNVSVGPGTRFTPAELTVEQGDTVTWTWLGGLHSVTSGTTSTDPNAGANFDSGILFNPSQPFSHTFDNPGDFAYFCIPHVNLGMRGTVHVSATQAPPAATPVPGMGLGALLSSAALTAATGAWTLVARRNRASRQPQV